jgi:hypothetical protein
MANLTMQVGQVQGERMQGEKLRAGSLQRHPTHQSQRTTPTRNASASASALLLGLKGWVLAESVELVAHFVQGAAEVCQALAFLRNHGGWGFGDEGFVGEFAVGFGDFAL